MKLPEIKEVEIYFKDAKEIRCLQGDIYDLTKINIVRSYHYFYDSVFIDFDNGKEVDTIEVWNKKQGFSDIICNIFPINHERNKVI